MSTASIKETLLQEVSVLPPVYYSEVLDLIETLKANAVKPKSDESKTASGGVHVPASGKRPLSEAFGIFKGKIWMADDFDAPLEEMREYME